MTKAVGGDDRARSKVFYNPHEMRGNHIYYYDYASHIINDDNNNVRIPMGYAIGILHNCKQNVCITVGLLQIDMGSNMKLSGTYMF